MECYIDDLKEEAQEEEDKIKRCDKETMNLKQQLQAMKDVEERLKSKEKEREFMKKEVDQLRHNAKNLECSLNMKQDYINNLERQLSRCGNIEIESIFKHKTGGRANRKKRF